MRIFDQEVELLLAVADIILIKAIVEIIACVLCANIERLICIGLGIWLAGITRLHSLLLLLSDLLLLTLAQSLRSVGFLSLWLI